ncbi:MAG: MFS transporter [Rhabdaerophilum sp.]
MTNPAQPAGRPALSPEVKRAIWGLGCTQIIGWGTTYYLLSLMGGQIARDIGLPKGVMLFGVSMTLVGAALLGPWIGRWQDRRGAREVMTAGSLLIATGLFAISRASDATLYFFGWTLISIATPMALYSAAFTGLTQLAGRQARRAIIFLTFLGGLASTISWPMTAWMLTFMDWRGVILFFALINFVICTPLHWLLMGGKPQEAEAKLANSVSAGVPDEATMQAFLLIAAVLATNAVIFNAWSLLVFPILEGLGFSASTAVFVASFVGICQVLGRMGEMVAGDRYTALQSATFATVLLPLSFLVLIVASGSILIGCLFALLYGISNGLMTIARGALTLVIFGSRGYGERLGKITFASGLAGAAAPVIGGFVLESAGTGPLIYSLLALTIASCTLMLMLVTHCRRHGLK